MNGQKLSHEKRLDRAIKIVFRQSINGRDANRVRDGTRLSPLVRKHFKADSYSDWGSAFLLKPLQFGGQPV